MEVRAVKIFAPFNRLRSHTYSSLPAGTILVPAQDAKYGYAQFFRERWAQKESFIVIEQDVVVTEEHIASMIDCTSDVCFSGYLYPTGQIEHGRHLGCVKFTSEFIKRHGTLFQDNDQPMDRVVLNTLLSNTAGKERCICYHGLVLHLNFDSNWNEYDKQKYGP